MQRKLKAIVAYDGTDFHGWQRQAGVRTVQEAVEDVLRRVLNAPVNCVGASRTDAGVHARGQVLHVVYDGPMPAERVRLATNHRLPTDVALVHTADVPLDFHATQHAAEKLYRYRIRNWPQRPADPVALRYAWHVRFPLDLDRMRAAAAHWVGTHDFSAFATAGSPRQSTVRTVTHIGLRRVYNDILVDIRGDGFLYNQVRNMVGTLVEIGRGHWHVADAPTILASGDRANAGPTAPPQGLCLQWIRYPARGRD